MPACDALAIPRNNNLIYKGRGYVFVENAHLPSNIIYVVVRYKHNTIYYLLFIYHTFSF